MNKIHQAVLHHIRESNDREGGKIAETLANKADVEIARLMFSSFRGRGESTKGMRLTSFGLELMKAYFNFYEVNLPENHQIQSGEILYLDRRASLPYYVARDKIVVFETELGIKLKLVDGEIATLIKIEA